MNLLFTIKALGIGGGGAERVLTQIAGELTRRGHSIEIVTFDPPKVPTFYPLHPDVRWHTLSNRKTYGRSGIPEILGRAIALRRYVSRHRPDVAIGFLHSSYVPLALALARTDVPVIASEHISFDHYRTRPAERALIRATAAMVKRMTAVTERVRQGFPPAIRRKMVAMPNPVTAPAGATNHSGHERREARTLLAVGRLEEQKDHRTLIAAFARVAEAFPEWTLRIVGDGSLRAELESRVDRLGMRRRIELPGAIADVASEYENAELFAMPSLYESFGLATAEALTYGIPAIGFSDCSGTNELIVDGVNGLLVRGDDRVTALAEGLSRLMSSSELRRELARAGPDSVKQYTLATVVDRWEDLARSVQTVQ